MLNGLENLTGKIIKDAQNYAEQTEADTKIKVDKILSEYNAEADALKAELVAAAKNEAGQVLARAKSQAALNERNDLLRARRELIDAAFSTACDMVADLPRSDYIDFLVRLVAKYQTGAAEIILNERDQKELGADLMTRIVINKIRNIDISLIRISKTCGKFKGGLILRQGDIDTNCTLEVLCEGMRHELEPQVIQQLGF